MARIRTIKPEFAEDETLGNVSREARLTYVLLWTRCDDFGRFRAAPALLASQLFPYDGDVTADKIESWLVELEALDRVRLYVVDGQKYGAIVRWSKHQRIDNAGKSNFPEPPDHPSSTRRVSANRGDSPLEGNGREGIVGTEGKPPSTSLALVDSPPQAATDPVSTVFDEWRSATGKHRARLDPKRKRLIGRALKDYPLDDVLAAVRGWRHSPHHRGENKQRTVYNDLDLLLRDADHIEKFRDLEHGTGPPPARAQPRGFAALQRLAGGEV